MSVRNIESVYPLTPLQQGMLFHTLLSPESGEYLDEMSCVFPSGLDVAAFERAWSRVLARHSALRTAFVWEGVDQPLQAVGREVRLPLTIEDWRGLPAGEREARAEALRCAGWKRVRELSKAPLMSLTLARLAEDTWSFSWMHHHLLLDGWSHSQVLREVLALYAAFRNGRELSFEPCRPFRDYVAWLQAQDLGGAEAFWRRALAGFRTPTPLPGDGSGRSVASADASAAPGRARLRLPTDTTAGLQALARRCQVTLSTLVQGAWGLLLGRSSGTSDVLFGVTVSGRPPDLPGVETMVGLFINTLPVRVRLPTRVPLGAWLRDLQHQGLEMRQHEHSPLVEVHGWSDVPRDIPLFESVVVFENLPAGEVLQGGGEAVAVRDVASSEKTNLPLLLVAAPGPSLALALVYDRRRFAATAAARLVHQLEVLLTRFAAEPEQPLASFALTGPAERQQLLVEWGEGGMPRRPPLSVHRLVEAQVAAGPERVAVRCAAERLTYRQLNHRANQLAHHLRGLGVRPGAPVGVYLDPSPAMIVGILGVLKAGGAYVPLDPSYPRERVAFLLDDACTPVLITTERLTATLVPIAGMRVVRLDSDAGRLARLDGADLLNEVGNDDPAYLCYTSGSTGLPKGVQVTQENLYYSTIARFDVYREPVGVFLLLSSFAFDSSVAGIFWTLCQGGMLVLPPDLQDALPELPRLIAREGVTHLLALPALYSVLLDEAAPGELEGLRCAIVAGEACPADLVQRHIAHLPHAGLYNEYGPTEGTVWCIVHRCGSDDDPVPIGSPIPGARALVLNELLEPAPVGVAGELWIGGVGLTPGYHRRPALTAERFVPDPYAGLTGNPGARLYRTGDLVRWRPDGRLEFLGRIDHQVKIRGHRIEPGEIEVMLREHPAIREAVVLPRETAPGNLSLVAYLGLQPDSVAPDPDELRHALGERLPRHLIPAACVPLAELPLTPNGKVDRRALLARPWPEAAGPEQRRGAGVTPVEEVIAGIWAEVLGLPGVDLEGDFFALGGHSLLATRALSRVRAAFRIDLPLRTLFEEPAPAGLARRIERAIASGLGLEAPPIVPVPRTGPLPLSYSQQRLWFVDQLGSGRSAYNVPLAVRLAGPLDLAALAGAHSAVVRRHETLRTTFAEGGGDVSQVIAPPAPQPLPVVDLSGLGEVLRDAELLRWTAAEARRELDLARGPLLRVTLLRLREAEHALLLTLHHIVSDAWSMGVLIDELSRLYAAGRAGLPSPLAPLPVQYADFAHWQRTWLQGTALAAQLGYWRHQLAGAPEELPLPVDRPRPRGQSHRGASERISLSPELSQRIRALARREGVTLFMVLLAAFQVLLHRLTGEEDLVVGTDIANRTQREVEGLIGLFVNQLVLRADLAGRPTFRESLRRVCMEALGAYAHQDLPFDRLVEDLRPERTLGRNPLFQVMLILQNAGAGSPAGGGMAMTPIAVPQETAVFDLSFALGDRGTEGIGGAMRYSTDLFDRPTIVRLLARFARLLESAVADPETRIADLEFRDEVEIREVAMKQNERKENKFSRLMNLKRTAVTLSGETLVKVGPLEEGQAIPWVIEPQAENVNPAAWSASHRELIERELARHGAVLFRGFPRLETIEQFEQLARAVTPDLIEYGERSSPRSRLGSGLYTSTDHPPSEPIVLHNEQSYTLKWPRKIWFYSFRLATHGGRTPLADSRRILARLRPETVQRFVENQVMYVRNYGEGLGLPWQEVFGTTDRSQVEEHCSANQIEVEWKKGDRLRTRQVRPAVRRHPGTGEAVWFNHALFFNLASLQPATRESMLAVVSEDEVPFNTFYGDGSPIEPEVLEELRRIYEAETVSFPWRQGDALLVDNMLVAHGREAFEGPRKVIVAMAEPQAAEALIV